MLNRSCANMWHTVDCNCVWLVFEGKFIPSNTIAITDDTKSMNKSRHNRNIRIIENVTTLCTITHSVWGNGSRDTFISNKNHIRQFILRCVMIINSLYYDYKGPRANGQYIIYYHYVQIANQTIWITLSNAIISRCFVCHAQKHVIESGQMKRFPKFLSCE